MRNLLALVGACSTAILVACSAAPPGDAENAEATQQEIVVGGSSGTQVAGAPLACTTPSVGSAGFCASALARHVVVFLPTYDCPILFDGTRYTAGVDGRLALPTLSVEYQQLIAAHGSAPFCAYNFQSGATSLTPFIGSSAPCWGPYTSIGAQAFVQDTLDKAACSTGGVGGSPGCKGGCVGTGQHP